MTLAMTIILAGLQLGIVHGNTLFNLPSAFLYLGSASFGAVPVSFIFAAIVFIVVGLFLRYHRTGRAIYAVGGDVRFVLDHGAKPDIASGRLEPWSGLVAELARRPNVMCKLSGLVTEAGPGWTAAQIAPYADRLLECFGPGRLMFGSDWPVCTLAASYGEVFALAREMLGDHLPPAERDAVFAGTAVTAYALTQLIPGTTPVLPGTTPRAPDH